MSILRTVRKFLLVSDTRLSRLVDVSRPDRLSSAEIASVCQAAGLQGQHFRNNERKYLTFTSAVRKNRYVILPIDFEDGWKVCLSQLCHLPLRAAYQRQSLIARTLLIFYLLSAEYREEGRRDARVL